MNVLGFLIGFRCSPSDLGRRVPNRVRIHAQERQLIEQGILLDELNVELRPIGEKDITKLKKFLPEIVITGDFPVPRIGEFIFEGNLETEFNFYSLLSALRILKKGDVRVSHTYTDKVLIYHSLPPIPATTKGLVYDLRYNELDIVHKIALNIVQHLKNSDTRSRKIRTALTWFNKSYDEHHGRTHTNQIIDLMICSEALFLDDKNYRNTGSVIGIACSLLIGTNGYERDAIKVCFEHAYTLRNKEVHGSDLSRVNDAKFQKRLRNIEDFKDEIYSYLRRAMQKLLTS